MLAVGREGETDEITLARGRIVGDEPIVRKIVQLIVAQVENGNRLASAGFLRPKPLIEQRGVVAIGAQRDGRGEAVGAREIAGDGERQRFAGGKIDSARAVGGADHHKHGQQRENSDDGDSYDLFQELFHELFHGWTPRQGCTCLLYTSVGPTDSLVGTGCRC